MYFGDSFHRPCLFPKPFECSIKYVKIKLLSLLIEGHKSHVHNLCFPPTLEATHQLHSRCFFWFQRKCTTHDDGQEQIAIDHPSVLVDLKIQEIHDEYVCWTNSVFLFVCLFFVN